MRTGREHAANWTQTRYKEHITLFFKHDSSHRKVGFFYRKMNDHLGIQISVHYVLTKDKNLSATEREIKKKKNLLNNPNNKTPQKAIEVTMMGGPTN